MTSTSFGKHYYDARGNLINSSGVSSYQYDSMDRLITATVTGGTATNNTYDTNDRMNGVFYDGNYNVSKQDGKTLTYDFEDRLKTVNGTGVVIVYDGDGNRVQVTAGGVTIKYLIDDLNPTGYAQVVEEFENSTLKKQYTFGHKLISQRQISGGVVNFYGYDGHGSVRLLTDASGAVTDKIDYDAFGIIVGISGSTSNNYLYTGEEYDNNIGSYYLRARYYNQAQGRLLTRDKNSFPLENPVELNKYVYVANDSVNKIDPEGLAGIVDQSFIKQTLSRTPKVLSTLGKEYVLDQATEMVANFLIGQARDLRNQVSHLIHGEYHLVVGYGVALVNGDIKEIITVRDFYADTSNPTEPDHIYRNHEDAIEELQEIAKKRGAIFSGGEYPSDLHAEDHMVKASQKIGADPKTNIVGGVSQTMCGKCKGMSGSKPFKSRTGIIVEIFSGLLDVALFLAGP
jgi:RHS repeat-associated protein